MIIETPKGSAVKYSYEPDTGLLTLSKALPEGMTFPFNFGFIPQTLAEDGDPLDVLVINEVPLIAGSHLHVRAAGVIRAVQSEGKKEVRNDRVIAQAIPKEAPTDLDKLKLTDKLVSQIETFFKSYNKASGKKFKVLGADGPKKADALIERAIKMARRKGE